MCTSMNYNHTLIVNKYNNQKLYLSRLRTRVSKLSKWIYNNAAVSLERYYEGSEGVGVVLPVFRFRCVVSVDGMFEGCERLERVVNLDGEHLNLGRCLSCVGMFDGCEMLESIDLSRLNMGRVRDMSHMFRGCKRLKGVVLSDSLGRDGDVKCDDVFEGCEKLVWVKCVYRILKMLIGEEELLGWKYVDGVGVKINV